MCVRGNWKNTTAMIMGYIYCWMSKSFFKISVMIIAFGLLSGCIQHQNPSVPTSSSSSSTSSIQPQACTQEAKQCADGTYVGRTGPNCSFAACPAATKKTGTLQGTITIGPICPVERTDHPCKPTPEMYAVHQIFVYNSGRTKLITTLTPDAQGSFFAVLLAGTYVVDVQHQPIGGVRGVPTNITIVAEQTATLSIDIDTGIR